MTLNIGENIKKLRAEKGVTQEQLGEHLSITSQSVSKWENSITVPDLYLIPAIAEYFEVSIDELFKPNMTGYKNKAQRLFAIYEQSGKKEDFERADAEYEKIFAEDKADGTDMRFYGILNEYRSYALAAKAEELYKQAISNGEDAEGQLLYLLSKTSRNEENIANYEQSLKIAPDNVRSWRLLISAYASAKMNEKAFDITRKALEKFPNDAGLLNRCGDLCITLKNYEQGIEYHKRAIEQNVDMDGSYFSIAFAYKDLQKYQESIEAWEKVKDFCIKKGLDVDMQMAEKEIAKLQGIKRDN